MTVAVCGDNPERDLRFPIGQCWAYLPEFHIELIFLEFMKKHAILVVDDDPTFCLMLQKFLEKKGLNSKGVFSAEEALLTLQKEQFDAVISDFRLPGKDGLELLQELRERALHLPVIIMTSYADIRIAVKAMKWGAADYVTKPVNPDEILLSLNQAIERNGTSEAPVPRTGEPSKKPATPVIKFVEGDGQVAQKLQEHIQLVAPTNISVLIQGESGSGKEYVAKKIHDNSKRASQPFVSIDCGSLSKELAASELFGHLKGSFTGAIQDKTGQFEAANGGTLFLDEIGNLSYDVQIQMLRALQERRVRKIGSNNDAEVDVRIIDATNEDLSTAVRKGEFREDLYHRLNEFSIKVAPLRERREDLESFCTYFLSLANEELDRSIVGFDKEVMDVFRKYSWPGNLRELRNIIRRAALLSPGNSIRLEALPEEIIQEPMFPSVSDGQDAALPTDLKSMAERTEKEMILQTLQKANYNKSKAAKMLGIDRKTLYNKMKQLGVE